MSDPFPGTATKLPPPGLPLNGGARVCLGQVVRGSLSKGIEMKLAPGHCLEDLRAGQFVVIDGRTHSFFALITDVSLWATCEELVQAPPEWGSAVHQVVDGTTAFATVSLRPMLCRPHPRATPGTNGNGHGNGRVWPGLNGDPFGETELEPVKSIPGHFAPVYKATAQDVEQVFGRDGEGACFHIGAPPDMQETPVCLNLARLAERSSGIFGKSGTGKTFLTRVVLCGLIRNEAAVTLTFDMHSEYGWQGSNEDPNRRTCRGLQQYFGKSRVALYALDAESARRRKVHPDGHIKIPYRQVEVEDILLLRGEMNLPPTAEDTLHALARHHGPLWLKVLKTLSPDEYCEGRSDVHPRSLEAVQRRVLTLLSQCEEFLVEDPPEDSVNAILGKLRQGVHVVVEFGRYHAARQYMLVANILTRRIRQRYVEQTEATMGDPMAPREKPLVICIEEAHRFLAPALAGQTIFGTIAREMRKYNVTLLVVDQRPSGIDDEVMSQIGTKVVCLLDDDKDIEAVLSGVSGSAGLRGVIATLDTKQQALLLGHAVPMPVVVQTRTYDDEAFWQAINTQPAIAALSHEERLAKMDSDDPFA
jgi:uncharacterized protein